MSEERLPVGAHDDNAALLKGVSSRSSLLVPTAHCAQTVPEHLDA